MASPIITDFIGTTETALGHFGLDSTIGSTSTALIAGDNLALGQDVTVIDNDAMLQWDGTITSLTGPWESDDLTCSNLIKGKANKIGESLDNIGVTVTDVLQGPSLAFVKAVIVGPS
jgi:hypothetical protein